MRKTLLLLFLLPFALMAQVSDDFSDGDFTNNPTWSGTDTIFIVNNNLQLQLNATIGGTAYLSLPIQEHESMEWHFWIREAFSPSGNNYSDVYLCADNADLTCATQGYFLRFGEAGSSDAITLFRKDADGEQRICRGTEAAIAASFSVAVKVNCDREGFWTVQTCYGGSSAYVTEAEGVDDTYPRSGYFGLLSQFTKSNAKKVYLDNVYVGQKIVDHEAPILVSTSVVDVWHLQLAFSEALTDETALNTANYIVDKGIGHPAAAAFGSNPSVVDLAFDNAFAHGVTYTLTVSGLTDLSGNPIQADTKVQFGIPNEIAEGDILINEIMFDPITPGVDYVELYNPTDKTYDLSELLLGVVKETFPNPADTTLKEIVSESRLLLPQSYVLLSTNSQIVGQQYECATDSFVEMSAFPSYPNSGGTAILMSKSGLVVDQMYFSEKMHYPSLKVTKGVALERVSFSQPSMDASNWHSAAERVHFGTPGYANSMMQSAQPSNDVVSISPETFSPDGDGIDDDCFINYHFDEAGYTMNIYIFNVAGQLVSHLAKGELVGQEGSVIWNGTDRNNNRVPIGVYIAVTEVFSYEGVVKQFKNAIVVATR